MENIKVTLVKGQDEEAPKSRCEKKLGMLAPLGEAYSRSRTADPDLDGRERAASRQAILTLPLSILGPGRSQGAVPRYKAGHTSSIELYRCLTLITILLRNWEHCFDFIDEESEGY